MNKLLANQSTKKEVGSQTPGEKSFWNWKLLLIEYDFQMNVVFFITKTIANVKQLFVSRVLCICGRNWFLKLEENVKHFIKLTYYGKCPLHNMCV